MIRKFCLTLACLALFAVGAQACNPLVSAVQYGYVAPAPAIIIQPSISVIPLYVQQPQVFVQQAVCPQVQVSQVQVQAAPQVVQVPQVSYGQSFVSAPLVSSFAYPAFVNQVASCYNVQSLAVNRFANVNAVNVRAVNVRALNNLSSVRVNAVNAGVNSVRVNAVNAGGGGNQRVVVKNTSGGLFGLGLLGGGSRQVVRVRN